jgi:UDP-N-acetylglucosamine 2-epimerase
MSMRVVTIVGARPQFIKAAVVSDALRRRGIVEIIIHTGQHYDANMSDVFFTQLSIPRPQVELGVGSGSHGAQTAAMLVGVEQVLLEQRPDAVLVYGDTNSTLAGALAASKLHIPVAHVEAGLRSFDRRMPEEVNRVLCDRLSTLLFCPSAVSQANLAGEGIRCGVHIVGDVMYDAVLRFSALAAHRVQPLQDLGVFEHEYYLATIHRAANTDVSEKLAAILRSLAQLDRPVVFPMHPRTRARLAGAMNAAAVGANVRVIDPVGYLEMLVLTARARAVLTDSGGLQKEAYWLGTPCVTLRDATEWVETVELGANVLVPIDEARIVAAAHAAQRRDVDRTAYGDGCAADRIAGILAEGCS